MPDPIMPTRPVTLNQALNEYQLARYMKCMVCNKLFTKSKEPLSERIVGILEKKFEEKKIEFTSGTCKPCREAWWAERMLIKDAAERRASRKTEN